MQIGRRTQLQRDDSWREPPDDDGGDPGSAVPELYHEHDPASDGNEGLIERADYSSGSRPAMGIAGSAACSCDGCIRGATTISSRVVVVRSAATRSAFRLVAHKVCSARSRCSSILRKDCERTNCTRLEIESFRTRGATVCEMTGRGRSRIRFS